MTRFRGSHEIGPQIGLQLHREHGGLRHDILALILTRYIPTSDREGKRNAGGFP
jgi:hypothetical protein